MGPQQTAAHDPVPGQRRPVPVTRPAGTGGRPSATLQALSRLESRVLSHDLGDDDLLQSPEQWDEARRAPRPPPGLVDEGANAGHVLTERPTVRRVHTWNAGENRWMLQIDEALGFRHRSPAACWQKLTG